MPRWPADHKPLTNAQIQARQRNRCKACQAELAEYQRKYGPLDQAHDKRSADQSQEIAE